MRFSSAEPPGTSTFFSVLHALFKSVLAAKASVKRAACLSLVKDALWLKFHLILKVGESNKNEHWPRHSSGNPLHVGRNILVSVITLCG